MKNFAASCRVSLTVPLRERKRSKFGVSTREEKMKKDSSRR
jgi:hypothetical protein